MNDILKTYMERFRENRHTLRRYTAFVLALAMITTLFVNWQLHGVGISMTAQYQCGEEEHTHTADCYTKVLNGSVMLTSLANGSTYTMKPNEIVVVNKQTGKMDIRETSHISIFPVCLFTTTISFDFIV